MSKSSIAIITSNHLRHSWLIDQLSSVCNIACAIVETKPAKNPSSKLNPDPEVRAYFNERDEAEKKWFGGNEGTFYRVKNTMEINWGESNSNKVCEFIKSFEPDLIVLFGCSIIKKPLQQQFAGRIINMHLGLSPYYRGSATNFWPLVDGMPECVGVTIHHATLKIDGGNIIMQARPDANQSDTSHDLGCKSIIAGFDCLSTVIQEKLYQKSGSEQQDTGILCRRNDFTGKSLKALRQNFDNGMLELYVQNKYTRDSKYPIVETV